jgi:hypothetical protein
VRPERLTSTYQLPGLSPDVNHIRCNPGPFGIEQRVLPLWNSKTLRQSAVHVVHHKPITSSCLEMGQNGRQFSLPRWIKHEWTRFRCSMHDWSVWTMPGVEILHMCGTLRWRCESTAGLFAKLGTADLGESLNTAR